MKASLGIVFVLAVGVSGCNDQVGASQGDINQAIADHATQGSAHHAKTVDASELTAGTLAAERLPASLAATDFTYSAAKTGRRRVPYSGFQVRATYPALAMHRGSVASATLAYSEGFASVEIPEGATVTRFACTMKKVLAAGTVGAFLTRYDANGTETYMANVTAGTTGATFADVEETTIVDPDVAAGDDFVIAAVLNPTGQADAADAALKGCVVEYTVQSVVP